MLEDKGTKFGRIIYLISDEPYDKIVYDGVKVPSLLNAYRHTLVANSYSKNLSLPGERIGFIAVNPEADGLELLLGGLVMCNRILGFVNAPAFIQRVLPKVLNAKVNVEEYKRKRDLLCDGLAAHGYEFTKPEGAFYLFPKTPDFRRCGVRAGPAEKKYPHGSRERLRRTRLLPDRLLRRRCHHRQLHEGLRRGHGALQEIATPWKRRRLTDTVRTGKQ